MTIGAYEEVRIQTQKILQNPTGKAWDLWLHVSDNPNELYGQSS